MSRLIGREERMTETAAQLEAGRKWHAVPLISVC